MDGGAWWATVHGIEKCWTRLSDLTDGSAVKNSAGMQETQEMWVPSLSSEDPLEEGMATHPSSLAWRIPWTEEPGRLQFIGFQRVEHYINDLACMLLL